MGLTFHIFVVISHNVWRLPYRDSCAWIVTVPTVHPGSRSQTSDSLVYVDVDIRFVDNFPM